MGTFNKQKKRHYLGLFSGWAATAGVESYNDTSVLGQFAEPGGPPEPDLVFAWYEYENYSGSACVVYRAGRKWFLNAGGHCSCYGLEGQWGPERFDARAHLKGLAQGRRVAFEYSDGPKEDFDNWLAYWVGR
jgi:hypothetical protein